MLFSLEGEDFMATDLMKLEVRVSAMIGESHTELHCGEFVLFCRCRGDTGQSMINPFSGLLAGLLGLDIDIAFATLKISIFL